MIHTIESTQKRVTKSRSAYAVLPVRTVDINRNTVNFYCSSRATHVAASYTGSVKRVFFSLHTASTACLGLAIADKEVDAWVLRTLVGGWCGMKSSRQRREVCCLSCVMYPRSNQYQIRGTATRWTLQCKWFGVRFTRRCKI